MSNVFCLLVFFCFIISSHCLPKTKKLQKKSQKEIFISSQLVTNAYSSIPLSEPANLLATASLFAKDAYGLDTQVLAGEAFEVNKTVYDENQVPWAEVSLPEQLMWQNGSWMPKRCFIQQGFCCHPVNKWEPNARITAKLTPVLTFPRSIKNNLSLGELSMGAPVKIIDNASYGYTKVLLASGFVGYVASDDLISDEALSQYSVETMRISALRAATAFLGSPYRWGCSSGFDPAAIHVTGVDCSGLVYLAYKSIGFVVPRDAHDQFMAASPVQFGSELQVGDLVFLSKISRDQFVSKMNHVMIVAENGDLIEAFGADLALSGVRRIKPLEHQNIGEKLSDLWNGKIVASGRQVFLGSFLGNAKTRNKLSKI